ncbi:MAG TPA: AgmX/PglI C-terminal domain-containing protein [Polyangiaceae bacterium]
MRFAFAAPLFLLACAPAETAPPPLRPAPVFAAAPSLTAPVTPTPPESQEALLERKVTEKPSVDPLCDDTQGPVAHLDVVRDMAAAALLYPPGPARAPFEAWIHDNAAARAADARAAVVYGVEDRRAPVDAMANAADEIAKDVATRSPYEAAVHDFLAADDRRAADCSSIGVTPRFGSLSPEIIQMIIRSNYGSFRQCYKALLRRAPKAQGRVATRIEIDRGGAVSHVEDGGSELTDPALLACMSERFRALRFPPPRKGKVTVVYPLIFDPGD